MADIFSDLHNNAHAEELVIIAESHFDYQNKFENAYHTPFFMASHSPLMRLPFYLGLKKQVYAHIFSTGIILDKKQELQVNSFTFLNNTEGQAKEMLILGEKTGNEFIAQILSDKYESTFIGNYLTICRKKICKTNATE
jgi:hypothetical protein